MITWGLWYWPKYLIVASLLFLAPEAYAFFTNHNNTLSDFAWNELGIGGTINQHHPAWWFSLVAWLVFFVVITGHIWFKNPS